MKAPVLISLLFFSICSYGQNGSAPVPTAVDPAVQAQIQAQKTPVPLRINSSPSDLALETTNPQKIQFTAVNPDGKKLNWSLSGISSPWLSINSDTGLLSWTPPQGPNADAAIRQAIQSGALTLRTPIRTEVRVNNRDNTDERDTARFRATFYNSYIETPKFRRIPPGTTIQEGQKLTIRIQCDYSESRGINITTDGPKGKGPVSLPTHPNEDFTWLPSFDVVAANDPDRKVTERLFFEAMNTYGRRDTMTVFVTVEDRPDCEADGKFHTSEVAETTNYLSQLQTAFITEHAQAEKRLRLRTTFDIGAGLLGAVGGAFGLLPGKTNTQTTTGAIFALAGATTLSIKLIAVPEDTKAAAREQELVAAINQISRQLYTVRNFNCAAADQKGKLQELTKTRDTLLAKPEMLQIPLVPVSQMNDATFLKAKQEYEKRHDATIETAK